MPARYTASEQIGILLPITPLRSDHNSKAKARRYGREAETIEPLIVLERDDGACGICGEDVDPMNFTIDHVVPFARGGHHTYDNVQVAHLSCNSQKSFEADQPYLPGTPAAAREIRVRGRDVVIRAMLEQGHTMQEIADATGVSYKTIQIRVRVMREEGVEVSTRQRGYRNNPHLNGWDKRAAH